MVILYGCGKINTIRLWLPYDAFRFEEDRQTTNFENAHKICEKYNCKVITFLFNCWNDNFQDNGGIYHTQMIPGASWCSTDDMYDSYIEKIVASHKDDDRIMLKNNQILCIHQQCRQ